MNCEYYITKVDINQTPGALSLSDQQYGNSKIGQHCKVVAHHY